jgi:AcrR family transcriptional regulator
MSGSVKRRYDATSRRQQAGATRERILTSARNHFLRDGYAATTMADIASGAEVSVQTVYKAFQNKPGLLKSLFDVAIAGDDDPVPLAARDSIAAVLSEPDPRRKIAMFAAMCAQIVPRAAPIQLLAGQVAAADPEISALHRQMREERLAGLAGFAAHLAEGHHLNETVTVEQARDILWTYNSPELFDLLVNQRGWSIDAYRAHINATVAAALLPGPVTTSGRVADSVLTATHPTSFAEDRHG